MSKIYDLLVIGGGINGTGIARDAAGRGLSVLLCEKADLAAHTSSASTKLIHGGLRYLEHYEFALVRKALQEREVLMQAAPHIIWPLRFVMPHDQHQRPAWLIRCGLFLYDHLARRDILPASQSIKLAEHPAGAALQASFKRGFVYSDGWVQDARLVVLNAMDAAERGARVLTRTACVSAQRQGELWHASLQSASGELEQIQARAIVNAAGPWVQSLLTQQLGLKAPQALRLVKGSHIVVKKQFDHAFAYIFQNPDQRIMFAIPYEEHFTLIGTTDEDYQGDPGQATISPSELDYLCQMSSRYFKQPIRPEDVLHTYSGVRPLLEDEADNAASVTRDYTLALEPGPAPLLSVFGGKITTYRKLAEETLAQLAPLLGCSSAAWTAKAKLPGGDMDSLAAFSMTCQQAYPWLPAALLQRYLTSYGTRLQTLIGTASQLADLGREVLPGVYEAELRYLVAQEWARSAEDILWRRSKLGLHLPAGAAQVLEAWLEVG